MLILCPHETPATSSNPRYSWAPSSVTAIKIGSPGGLEDGFSGKEDVGGEKKSQRGWRGSSVVRALSVPVEDRRSILSTHKEAHNHL